MIILLMGVAGAGKTAIGRRLAAEIGISFHDADAFHSPANVDKMRRGLPLDDADRAPWILALSMAIDKWKSAGEDAVLACSALRAAHRDVLLGDRKDIHLVHLVVPPEVARARVARRRGHYMKQNMIDSQFEALEPPEDALSVDATAPPDAIVARIRSMLGR
ncbi:gluconokinase [Polyangium aurulentum]|uniref:gluconokinase n=1 Tax=Polyangium aurulentum TaxID=2567896 RepID=UPI0010AE4FB4|nr:gluconokinase, GntK/IdnK-type [Polyangium aurulentum]UQA57257.1 AAA family ATPase [Polyangium aurulentum]